MRDSTLNLKTMSKDEALTAGETSKGRFLWFKDAITGRTCRLDTRMIKKRYRDRRIVELYAQGLTQREISKEVGCSLGLVNLKLQSGR